MQLSALKLLSDDAQEKTILYSYDEAGRLTGKQFPGGNRTDYSYNGAGKIKEILHTGADFTERYHYDYDVMGNKVLAEKERPGLPEDSGNFSYDYDALNRLTSVACNGKTLRTYGYDAFGNRNTRTEYQAAGELVTTYHYNTKNQLMQETNAGGTRNYNYDHRGNLLSVTSGEEVLKAYGFDAANRMSSSVDRTAGEITKAYYQYNGLGHRVGQTIASGNADVTQTIRYTLDLTRQYHNLLQKTGNGLDQTYFWDGNVTGMEENGRDHFYFQDDLGSPMRLTDEDGRSEEVYGFDEFGNDIRTAKDIFKDSLQSFGFTGYQMDSVGALYFAQARRYEAGVGRFISEDFIKGHIAAPYTMNHYNYCWNRPLDLVDLNGMEPTAGVIKALMDMLKCDETVSYIFYTTGENSDFTDQANWKKEQLESEGKNVVMIPIANANDFVDGWNHMGMTPDGIANIEDVEIYTHSNETTFIFIDNTETEALSISGKNKSGKAIKGISDLSYKEIETLNIYGCNSGNLSTYFRYDANIASELSKIVSGDVYAYDGNVGFGPTWTRPFSKYGEYEDRLSNIQKSYIKISLKNGWLNEPMGKLRYKEGKLDGKCDE
jgi:rhs family protein